MDGLEGWLGDENTGGVDWLGMSSPLGKKLLLDLPSRSSRSSMEEWTDAKEEEISFRDEEESLEDSTSSSSALLSSSCRG